MIFNINNGLTPKYTRQAETITPGDEAIVIPADTYLEGALTIAAVIKAGLYVWKKTKNITISFTQLTNGTSPTTVKASSSDIDLSKRDITVFEGCKGNYASGLTYEFDEQAANNKIKINGSYEDCTYNPATQIITIATTFTNMNTWNSATKEDVAYVVNDNANAYSDGYTDTEGYSYGQIKETEPELSKADLLNFIDYNKYEKIEYTPTSKRKSIPIGNHSSVYSQMYIKIGCDDSIPSTIGGYIRTIEAAGRVLLKNSASTLTMTTRALVRSSETLSLVGYFSAYVYSNSIEIGDSENTYFEKGKTYTVELYYNE